MIDLVDSSLKGVLVDDELLKFTYKAIKKDINKCIDNGLFIKVEHSHSKKQYFIFSTQMEQQYHLENFNDTNFPKDLYL